MSEAFVPYDELSQLARDMWHHKQAHHDNTADGIRRRIEGKMEEIRLRFERTLDHFVPDELDRERWRAALYHGAELPPPPAVSGQVVFRGRDELGAYVEVREHDGDRDCEVRVDGARVARVRRQAAEHPVFQLDNAKFAEIFCASPEAIEALAAYVADPADGPPWRYAAELAEDGLVDLNFSITPRGRRALAGPG